MSLYASKPRSTDDAIAIALHTALYHLDKRNTYVRMLFINYSSAFNTIVPSKLDTKLKALCMNISLCSWIQDFLTGRPQVVRVGNNTSATLTLCMKVPQGCMLSHILYSMYTHNCVATHDSNTNIRFADDMMVVGLIANGDKTAYREEVRCLFNFRRLKKFGLGPRVLKKFYSCIIKSISTSCITVWYGNCTDINRKALQRVVQRVVRTAQDIYSRQCLRKSRKTIKDSRHTSHRLFMLLPSAKRYQSIGSQTNRLRDNYYCQAIRLLKTCTDMHLRDYLQLRDYLHRRDYLH
ncbi:uncharacterized protein LOC115193031 [Salmo trutta]|uniref:uncharacterized protein LOC115193031 n=1 Tax=Salmo trutta TaxID=8032 RepID=UPI001130A23F|nr:uncharacterized protein LOC115193031 [Salmo trutta]